MHQFAVLTVLEALGIAGVVFDDDFKIVQSNEPAEIMNARGFRLESAIESIRPDLEKWRAKIGDNDKDGLQKWFVANNEGKRPFAMLCLSMGTRQAPHYLAAAFIDFNRINSPKNTVLRDVFGLTNAEAQVASLVAQGRSTSQIAAELGTAVATVRVQLKSVFAKTKTRRQSELAAVLGRASIYPSERFVITHLSAMDDLGKAAKSEPD